MAFLLDVSEKGYHVALISTLDLEAADRIIKALKGAGFGVKMKHQPASVEFKWTEGKGGGGAKN